MSETRRDVLRGLAARAPRAVGVATAGVAGSFAAYGASTHWVVNPMNRVVVDVTPGAVVITAIRRFGHASELLLLGVAALLTVAVLAAGALVGARVGEYAGDRFAPVLGVYFAGWGVAAALTGSPIPALVTAVTMGVAAGAAVLLDAPADESRGRRRFLARVAGLTGFGALAAVVGSSRTDVSSSSLFALSPDERAAAEERLQAANEKSLDVGGMPGLVSSTSEFYEVDIDPINPDPSENGWTVSVTGDVETRKSFSFGDLVRMETSHQFSTLRCVGDPLNGDLMDTALWTGVPVSRLLDEAGPTGDYVVLRAVDGYYEEFPLAALEDGFLAYGMNANVLPRSHGFPVRVLVPGHWGEINVKWLTEIEVSKNEQPSFWERRGWHGTGPVNTVAKLWASHRLGDGRMRIGGHAYAGTRGIQKVEVSLDGGDTWTTASLSPRLPDADTWRQWTYTWRPDRDAYDVVVRAVDGTGALQPREDAEPYPGGATGWVRETIRV